MTNHRAKVWKLSLLFGSATVLISFQNCSNPGGEMGEDPNSILAAKMDFAYDATIDQIAYMSCSNLKDNIDTDTYFSIRAGAYRDGGIRLKDEFFQTYEKKNQDRMIELLNDSPANTNTVLQLAVRERGALNRVVHSGVSGEPKQGSDFANLLFPLGGPEMTAHLVKSGLRGEDGDITGKRTKNMRLGNGQGAHMEGSLRFGNSESFASSLRDSFLSNGKAVLALTYAEASGAKGAATDVRTVLSYGGKLDDEGKSKDKEKDKTSDDPTDHAFGRTFALSFSAPPDSKGLPERKPDGTLASPYKQTKPHPTAWLTMVQEGNLSDPSDSRSTRPWVCPENLRFRIIRSELDLKDPGATCLRQPDPDTSTLSKEEAFRVQLARNSLRVEDWYIDFTPKGPREGGCIIPKKNTGTCYGDLNYVRYEYKSGEGCDPDSTKQSNSVKSRACLAWVSICYRQ